MHPILRCALLAGAAGLAVACSGNPGPASEAPRDYAALADTLVCVVDRTADTGLRELPAKKDADGAVVLLSGGQIRPLDSVHPVSLVAGYAGRERWLAAGEPIDFRGDRFVQVQEERRVAAELLGQVGEHRGIPLFADPGDEPPPEALYVPMRPGCIFQAYVREDLMR